MRIQGDGTPCRSYLYAADLAVWLWTILTHGESARPYNVGSGRLVTIEGLARTIVKVANEGTPIEIAGTPVPGAPPARYVPSVERAHKELGLEPLIPIEEAVLRTYNWANEGK